MAKPGASFSVGQTARVTFVPSGDLNDNHPTSTLAITVQSIEKGTLADFKGVQLDAQARAGSPRYVTVKIANVGSKPVGNINAAGEIQGIDDTGSLQTSLTIIGDFPRCNGVASEGQIAPGKSQTVCEIFMVPGGITKVAYTGSNAYETKPVTWK